jgi:predicted DNA-binding helix-hairpin-helix protein
MDALKKMMQMIEYARMERDGEPCLSLSGETRHSDPRRDNVEVFHAKMGGGKTIALLKTMMTSYCENDCNYCVFRKGRDFQRISFGKEGMAALFMEMVHKRMVEGLFLSSGVAGSGVKTQDRIIDTIEIIRHKYQFGGYIHLKIMPGAEDAQIERALQLADRISINLEAPNPSRLKILAPSKEFDTDLMRRLSTIDHFRRLWYSSGKAGKVPSTITQLVTGGAGENDVEMLGISEVLYRKYSLARVYYSPFEPAVNTPLENHPPVNHMRPTRLYQASFLLRDYGFGMEELPFDSQGFLSMEFDPKLFWAQENLVEKPLEINKADFHELIRIPGIGRKTANRILKLRMQRLFVDSESNLSSGLLPPRAMPFILVNGRRPAYQPRLL